jgi:outer membrane protein assembly factor BamB
MYRELPEPSPLVLLLSGNQVLAHRRGDGELAWQCTLDRGGDAYRRSRCVIAADRVIIASAGQISGWSVTTVSHVRCVEYRTGRVLWDETPSTSSQQGFAVGVLVEGDLVFVVTSGILSALDLATGKLAWSRAIAPVERVGSMALALPGQAMEVDTE